MEKHSVDGTKFNLHLLTSNTTSSAPPPSNPVGPSKTDIRRVDRVWRAPGDTLPYGTGASRRPKYVVSLVRRLTRDM